MTRVPRRRLALLALLLSPPLAAAAVTPASASVASARVPSAAAGYLHYVAGTVSPVTDPASSYDTAGGSPEVLPLSAGQYLAVFPGLYSAGLTTGDAQVTATDNGAACSVGNQSKTGSGTLGLQILIDCYNPAGVLADESYDLTVTQPTGRPAGVLDYAKTTNAAGSGSLKGDFQYNSSGKTNSVRHVATGQYVVTLPGPRVTGANTGTVKVSPVGPGAGSCQVASWASTHFAQRIGVDCFSAAGAAQDRLFTIAYARGNNLLGLKGKTDASAYSAGSAAMFRPAVQYDSRTGARITILHLDTGLYEAVFFGSLATSHPGGDGDLQLSPVSGFYRDCTTSPAASHTPYSIIRCVNSAGKPVNSAFTVQLVIN